MRVSPRQPSPVLVAPDAFKGTLRASEVAARDRARPGARRAGPARPHAGRRRRRGDDRGAAARARRRDARRARVAGRSATPCRRASRCSAGGDAAIVEVAQASGLELVPRGRRDAEAATTHGTGELILAAVDAGAEVVFVGRGGSATTDGGAGALEAIADGRRAARRAARRALRRADDVRGRAGALRRRRRARTPRRSGGWSAGCERLAGTLAARPARRPADGRGGRAVGRAVGGARRRARAGGAVRPRHARTPARGCARRAR